MIEVLNPARATPTTTSHLTANELISPSQRVKDEDTESPGRRSAMSPEGSGATVKGNAEDVTAASKTSDATESAASAKDSAAPVQNSAEQPEPPVSTQSPEVARKRSPEVARKQTSPPPATATPTPVVSAGRASPVGSGEGKTDQETALETENKQGMAAIDDKASGAVSEAKQKLDEPEAEPSAGSAEKEGPAMDTTS